MIQSIAEIESLIQLNLSAAQQARSSTAFEASNNYCKIGLSLLKDEAWSTHYSLTLSLKLLAMETSFLLGDYDSVQQYFEDICQHSSELLDRVEAYAILLSSFVAQGQHHQALQIGREILSQLSVKLPETPKKLNVFTKLQETKIYLAGHHPNDLASLRPMSDSSAKAALKVMNLMMFPAFFVEQKFIALLALSLIHI